MEHEFDYGAHAVARIGERALAMELLAHGARYPWLWLELSRPPHPLVTDINVLALREAVADVIGLSFEIRHKPSYTTRNGPSVFSIFPWQPGVNQIPF